MSTPLTDVNLQNAQDIKGYSLHISEMKAIKADFFKLNPPLRSLYYYGGRLKITKSVHNNKHKFTYYSVLSVGLILLDIQYNL
jgi:hypothetical protein